MADDDEEHYYGNDQIDDNLAITKGYFDQSKLMPIDDICEPIDEIELFIITASDVIKDGKKQACKDIFNQIRCFFALKAYDANLVMGEMKAADHAIKMKDTYEDLVNNLPLVSDYNELFFSKWPGGKLPDKYKIWIDDLFKDGPGSDEKLEAYIAKNASKYRTATKEVKLKVYFGSELLKDAKEGASIIKTQHNR